MRRHAQRNGFGLILAITTLFLLTWGVVGVAQLTFSGQVTDSVQATTVGNLAVAFAESAIEEAFHQVSRRLNQPGDPLYTSFREDYRSVSQARKKFQVSPSLCLGVFERDPLFAGFELAGNTVEVQLLSQRALTSLSYELKGTLAFTARVRHPASRVARTVSETRGFKVALVSTPRPFDQVTWLLRKPSRLFETFPEEANTLIDRSLATVGELDADRDDKLTQVQQMLDAMNREVQEANDAIEDLNRRGATFGLPRVDDRAESWLPQETVDPISDADIATDPGFQGTNVEARFHKFPPDLIVYSVGASLPAISQKLYLPPKVAAQTRRIDEQATQHETALGRLQHTYNRAYARLQEIQAFRDRASRVSSLSAARQAIDDGADLVRRTNRLRQRFAQACQDYADSSSSLSKEHETRWMIYVGFTDALLELSGAKAAELARYDSKFDVAANELSQVGRAFFRFTGPGAAGRLRQFLADASRPGSRPLNATIFVDNAEEPLRLDGLRLHGKLALAATGPVDLSNIALADPANDLFTLHTAAGRAVRISGRVCASLMAAGAVDLSEGALLHGNLIQWDLPAPANLNGTLQNDPRYFSGVSSTANQKLDHFVVAVHPIPSSRAIARN